MTNRRNRYISSFILNERNKYREELNNILGDISPYWDLERLYDEDINYSEDYYSSDSENEYYEEYY